METVMGKLIDTTFQGSSNLKFMKNFAGSKTLA